MPRSRSDERWRRTVSNASRIEEQIRLSRRKMRIKPIATSRTSEPNTETSLSNRFTSIYPSSNRGWPPIHARSRVELSSYNQVAERYMLLQFPSAPPGEVDLQTTYDAVVVGS